MTEHSWDMMTPEAARPPAMAGARQLPGEGTIGARRMTSRRSPTKRQEPPASRWSRIGATAALVPWGALVGCTVMLTGLIIFLVHAKAAASQSRQVLSLVQSATHGYPHLVTVYSGSYPVTAGLAGGCILASAFLALVRLRQKLIKRDSKKEWGKFKASLLSYLAVLAMLVIVLPSIWMLLNSLFVAAWGFGMWTLEDAATVAGVNMLRWNVGSSPADAVPDAMAVTQAKDMICPSETCFNMGSFPWLESVACLCTQQLVVALQTDARAALDSIIWSLAGTGCMLVGALISAVQAGADVALLRADQQFIALSRRRQASAVSYTAEQEKYAGSALAAKHALHGPIYARSPQMVYQE